MKIHTNHKTPTRYCKVCGEILTQKVWQGKTRQRKENKSRFLVRMYCGSECRANQLSIDGSGEGNYFYGKHLVPWNRKEDTIIRHKVAKGYIELRIRQENGKTEIIYEHRYVIEKHLDRKLESKEIVHHIDQNRSNNELNNLRLFSSNKEHLQYHANLRKIAQIHINK